LGKEDYNKALEYTLKSLDILELSQKGNHPDVAAAYSNVGYLYMKQSEYKKALEYFVKSLKISRLTFGETHPETMQLHSVIHKIIVIVKNNEQNL